jgi:hypothetical protein
MCHFAFCHNHQPYLSLCLLANPGRFNHVFADHVGVSIPARVAEAEWQAFASIFFYLSR